MQNECTPRIIPAVIPDSVATVQALTHSYTFTPTVQIDVVDGVFATPASWPYHPVGEPAEVAAVCERFDVQVDIMAVDPLAMATAWVAAGATQLVIHLESVADLAPIVALTQQHGIKLWLSGADTLPVARYEPHFDYIYGVQLMGIHTIGQQGQPLSDRVYDNIAALRTLRPDLPIQIDGSVNATTIQSLHQAGATAFAVGSAISAAADPRAAYQELLQLLTAPSSA